METSFRSPAGSEDELPENPSQAPGAEPLHPPVPASGGRAGLGKDRAARPAQRDLLQARPAFGSRGPGEGSTTGAGDRLRPLEIREVEGNHYSILREPNVEVLADGLKEVLDPARAPGGARKMPRPMR